MLVLPLLAAQLLWINLITDSGPTLAMGLEPETEDEMARSARAAGERAIDAAMGRGVVSTGLVMSLVTLLTIDMQLSGGLAVEFAPLNVAFDTAPLSAEQC